jgi:hypothetical protein
MIWGEIVNQVRNLHADFLDEFHPQTKSFSSVELEADSFPYPADSGEYGEWEPSPNSHVQMEVLELHPVERVLLEGPLLPIQEVKLQGSEWNLLEQAILELEMQFLQKTKLHQPEQKEFIQKKLHARFMQLQRHSGQLTLKAL